MQPILRRTVALWLPVAVAATGLAGLGYGAVQQDYRRSADDPQLQIAHDAAASLTAGASPTDVASGTQVDLATSLAPFVIVYDTEGTVLASTGTLDGTSPVPPPGVLQAVRENGQDAITWQPRDGVRLAIDAVAWKGSDGAGTVLAGRSLREVERRVDELTLMVAAGWLVTMLAAALAAFVGAYLWGTTGGGAPPPRPA